MPFLSSGEIIESPINGQSEINLNYPYPVYNVSRSGDDHAGEEEVNIGYGTVKKRDLLTPVARVNGTHSRYSSYTSIYDMLRTQPGVIVNGRRVIIQGISTFYGNTEPLYILDGCLLALLMEYHHEGKIDRYSERSFNFDIWFKGS